MFKKVSIATKKGSGFVEGMITSTNNQQFTSYLLEQEREEGLEQLQTGYSTVAVCKNLFVNPKYRSKGLGAKLFEAFINKAIHTYNVDAVVLIADTNESNNFELVEWYHSMGFEVIDGYDNEFPLMVMEA